MLRLNLQLPPGQPPSCWSWHSAAFVLGTHTSELPVSIWTRKSCPGVPTVMFAKYSPAATALPNVAVKVSSLRSMPRRCISNDLDFNCWACAAGFCLMFQRTVPSPTCAETIERRYASRNLEECLGIMACDLEESIESVNCDTMEKGDRVTLGDLVTYGYERGKGERGRGGESGRSRRRRVE